MAEQLKKRSEMDPRFQWNLEDIIPSKEALETLLSGIEADIPQYETYKGTLSESADAFKKYLDFDESMDERLSRLMAYAMQKSDEDTSVGESQALVSTARRLTTKAASASAFAEPELLSIPEPTMEKFLNTETLSHYKKYLERILVKRPHMLTAAEEVILAQAADVAQAPSAIYNLFNNADLKFPAITDENGVPTELTHGRFIGFLTNRDREVRKAAFQAFYSSYRQFANTVAASFEANVKQACFFARVRKYPSSRAMYLAANEVPETVYDNLIKATNDRIGLLHRYVSIRKKLLGVSELHMYDLYTPLVSEISETCTYERAKELIKENLTPLGEEYGKLLSMGFESRWIDVYENEGKRSGGYSNCVYGVHPYVLMSYNNTMESALTLAHEMGHSLHSWYSNHAQPYTYAHYKIFVAEVASTCNEVIFLRQMMKKAGTPGEKKFYINQLLEKFRGTMFRQTMFAEFEWEAHKRAWKGVPLTKEELCSLYRQLNVRYFGPDMAVDQEIDYEWERIPHFYRPFYVYQYSTGFAAATAIATRILSGDEDALRGYFSFLKGGSSKTPVELLKLCGLDMESPAVIHEAFDVFEALLDELEA